MDYYELLRPAPEPKVNSSRGLVDNRLKNELVALTERLSLVDHETAFHIMKKRCNDMTDPKEILECHKLGESDLSFLKSLLAYGLWYILITWHLFY